MEVDWKTAVDFSKASGPVAVIEEMDVILSQTGHLFDRMRALPAQTQAGRAAKVRTLLAYIMGREWRGRGVDLDWDIDHARARRAWRIRGLERGRTRRRVTGAFGPKTERPSGQLGGFVSVGGRPRSPPRPSLQSFCQREDCIFVTPRSAKAGNSALLGSCRWRRSPRSSISASNCPARRSARSLISVAHLDELAVFGLASVLLHRQGQGGADVEELAGRRPGRRARFGCWRAALRAAGRCWRE